MGGCGLAGHITAVYDLYIGQITLVAITRTNNLIPYLPYSPHCNSFEDKITANLFVHDIDVSKHDDVIKWKHFPCYWTFVWGIHRSPLNSPLKGQWRGALIFSLIYAWTNGWVNNREAGDLGHHRAHHDVIVIKVIWKWAFGLPGW